MRSLHNVVLMVLVTLASGGLQAAKPGGGTPPPSGSACMGQGGVFPAMAYSRGVYSNSGAYQKTQVFVANSLGNCEVMVYDTGDYTGKPVKVSFHYDPGSSMGTLVWKQDVDNGKFPVPGRIVKLARFQVSGGAVVGLPIAAATIYRFPATLKSGIDDVELSQDGTRVAFSEYHKLTDTGPWTLQILVCNVADAVLGQCQTTAETAYTVTASSTGGSHQLTIGRNAESGERIYFLNRPGATLDVADLVAVDNLGGNLWTAPVVLVNREQYMASMHDTDTFLETPSALSLPGEPDRVLLSSRDGFLGNPRVDIYDAANGTVAHIVGQGFRPTWTSNPSIDSTAPNVLVTEKMNYATSPVREIDLDGQPETSLGVQGYAVDSAY